MSKMCINCRSSKVQEVVKENHRFYLCDDCQTLSPRAFDSRYGRMIGMHSPQGLVHYSIGGIISRNNQYLLIKRRGYPFGYSIPAGHIEQGEEPLAALKREVTEETGLTIHKADLLFHGELDWNKCRYGANSHIWHLYACECNDAIPILSAEHEAIGWYTYDEVLALNLVPIAKYFFGEVVKPPTQPHERTKA